jgi:hypothetical protein
MIQYFSFVLIYFVLYFYESSSKRIGLIGRESDSNKIIFKKRKLQENIFYFEVSQRQKSQNEFDDNEEENKKRDRDRDRERDREREKEISLTYRQVLKYLIEDQQFRIKFIEELKSIPMESFYWECPPLTSETAEKPFEFVVIKARLHLTKTNYQSFEKYFINCEENIVSFQNIGKDATLVVPCPIFTGGSVINYGHFAEFLRNAPANQIEALLIKIGQVGIDQFRQSATRTKRPIWLSTSGGGVPWLHIRFDSIPKYYNWAPYKRS